MSGPCRHCGSVAHITEAHGFHTGDQKSELAPPFTLEDFQRDCRYCPANEMDYKETYEFLGWLKVDAEGFLRDNNQWQVVALVKQGDRVPFLSEMPDQEEFSPQDLPHIKPGVKLTQYRGWTHSPGGTRTKGSFWIVEPAKEGA